ncbi:MAG: ribosome small subunit-dependent GTPase A [Schleiferiaceae bacterium]|jgi:ribosome biogenesis GTPase|nr:ribosome small subunit-dependent GTPase A [Schleiferiaceae bacterium]
MQGIVSKSTGSWYTVRTEQGVFACRIRGKLRLRGLKSTNPVAVGDAVELEREGAQEGVITGLLPRRNYILRKSVNLSKQVQILAANVDQALLMATLAAPPTFQRFIDRFAVTAEAYEVPFCLVFNKLDLYTEAQLEEMEFLTYMYEDAGYPVLHTSVADEAGLDLVQRQLKDQRTLISGHSGVGKSSLINALAPQLQLKTTPLSDAHQQGQHTTTFAELHELPFGGQIIDTPGIKGFGLVDMDKQELGDYFPEILARQKDCKFNDCLHREEPGCAVKAAVEAAELAYPRYESYLSFLDGTDTDETYRTDIHA